MTISITEIIERKRDGGVLKAEEISAIIERFTSGAIPDYQMSALAMAIFFRGMSRGETAALTRSMRESGTVMSYPEASPPKVDKHSTGGVGDKTSLILAPLLACDGLWVPMISGRGLGITGGTLDKLDSIPGFRTNLKPAEIVPQLEAIGALMAAQTEDFCPADRKLYALRDVTGTVPSQPLIVASIMCKKLAESLDRLVLDVKFGSGAFMKTKEQAKELAAAMVEAGQAAGVEVRALLNPMSEPLGHAVGNALEVAECVSCLQGKGPEDLETLVLELAEQVSRSDRAQLTAWLRDGTAYAKFQDLVNVQGGSVEDLERMHEVHRAPVILELHSPASGRIVRADAGITGRAALNLGAGRQQASDSIDFAVGFDEFAKVGSEVVTGDPLARIHARSRESAAEAALALHDAFEVQ